MSSFKNFSSMLNDLQQQADGRGTLDGSAIEDFLSIAGYKMPAGGGGGGGDSDFSLAKVAITNDTDKHFLLSLPNVYEGVMYGYIDSDDIDGSDIDVVLYKGEFTLYNTSEYALEFAVTGDIEMGEDSPIIKGDGTITITESPGV